ncbi:MAG: hypothetical protein MN733_36790, partial [Nitrososphaera sp.]|nr:hypothetical protein [Nitrososphaera sp.]
GGRGHRSGKTHGQQKTLTVATKARDARKREQNSRCNAHNQLEAITAESVYMICLPAVFLKSDHSSFLIQIYLMG